MTYDAAHRVVLLFGGQERNRPSGELWQWDGTTWRLLTPNGPAPRYLHGLAYDTAREAAVLFGGRDDLGPKADTWEWNGAAWSSRQASGPVPIYSLAMAYDAARGVTVRFGGLDRDAFSNDETWEWDGLAWARRTGIGPSERKAHAMAYDAARARIVFFGGFHWSVIDDTWELRQPCSPPSITDHPVSQLGCPIGPATFTVTVAGTGPLTFQWRRGVPPVSIPGATGDTYTISHATRSDIGRYECVVTNACGSATSDAAFFDVCIGDFNCDGGIDGADIGSFFDAWATGESVGDVNSDGGVDGNDVEFFYRQWETDC